MPQHQQRGDETQQFAAPPLLSDFRILKMLLFDSLLFLSILGKHVIFKHKREHTHT
jgi:hypothetical protein